VLAVCVAVLPFGVRIVNVTLAPETGAPPLMTDAVTGTVLGREKLAPATETLTASDGAVMTVALAFPTELAELFEAFKLTA